MTDPRTLAERLFAAMDDHRWDDVTTVVQPDAEISTPFAQGMSVAAWLDLNHAFATAFPDGRHTITDVIADGDRVAIEGTWSGTHTGPMAGPGGEIPATGRSVTLPFCGVATVRDDRIAAVTMYLDQMAMLAQLGILPEPASAA
jgi:steroid delta-isomerase-like uncharacterized protein